MNFGVCGPTHQVVSLHHDYIHIVNPKSVMLPNHKHDHLGTVAVLEIKGSFPQLEIMKLEY